MERICNICAKRQACSREICLSGEWFEVANNYGTVETARLMQAKDLPEAGPVLCYKLEEEIETRIASNLQTLIRIGKPEIETERDERRGIIQQIIIECCKELDKDLTERAG